MSWNFLVKPTFLLVVAVTGLEASASQFSRCAVYLLSARQRHFIDSNSAIQTQQAVEQLKAFRFNVLRDFKYDGSTKPVDADERSRNAILQKVTGRVSGILFESKEADVDTDDTQLSASQEVMYGSVVEGEDLLAEIDFRTGVRNDANRYPDRLLPMAIFVTTAIPALVLVPVLPLLTTEIPAARLAAGLTVAAAAAFWFRGMPEQIARLLSSWQRSPHEDVVLRQAIENLAPNQWKFHSLNIRIPASLVRNIWQKNEISENDFNNFIHNYDAPRTTFAATSDRLSFPTIAPAEKDDGWLRVDELLFRDPATGKPKLITFLRVSKRLPIYPQTSSATTRIAPIKVPELNPIGALGR